MRTAARRTPTALTASTPDPAAVRAVNQALEAAFEKTVE